MADTMASMLKKVETAIGTFTAVTCRNCRGRGTFAHTQMGGKITKEDPCGQCNSVGVVYQLERSGLVTW